MRREDSGDDEKRKMMEYMRNMTITESEGRKILKQKMYTYFLRKRK